MSRKEYSAAFLVIAGIILGIVAAILPATFSEQHPSLLPVLAIVGGLSVLVALVLLIPVKAWKAISGLFPVRILPEIALQFVSPSRFLFIQKPRFVFLPMSGGQNYKTWSFGFNVVSCLFRDLKVDRIDIDITYPITETWAIRDDILLSHSGSTKIASGIANMSDTTFHYLEKESKILTQKELIDIRCNIIGFRNGKKIFTITDSDCYKGELTEWGKNNP